MDDKNSQEAINKLFMAIGGTVLTLMTDEDLLDEADNLNGKIEELFEVGMTSLDEGETTEAVTTLGANMLAYLLVRKELKSRNLGEESAPTDEETSKTEDDEFASMVNLIFGNEAEIPKGLRKFLNGGGL